MPLFKKKTPPEPPPPPLWPVPTHSPIQQYPLFLFVFAPPYSGSTALAGVLNSAPWSMVLNPNGEGQWLVPGLIEKTMRWEPGYEINWDSVKAVWGTKIRTVEQLVGRVDVVIEKSPPNMVRAAGLLATFPEHAIIVLNRNPYANCASVLYRNHQPEEKTADEREKFISMLSKRWLVYAGLLREILTDNDAMLLNYETFCRDTEAELARIVARVPQLQGMNTDAEVRVKDYVPQPIADQNARQIAQLTTQEKARISELLTAQEELVRFFGYSPDWKDPLAEGGAS